MYIIIQTVYSEKYTSVHTHTQHKHTCTHTYTHNTHTHTTQTHIHTHTHAANLAPDPAISAVSQYQVHAGDSITLPCAFRPGALSSNYSLEWQKQLATIYRPQGISLPQRYRILENYSLVISGAEVTDSNLYQCSVRVTYSNGPTITGYAPPFRLIVIGEYLII